MCKFLYIKSSIFAVLGLLCTQGTSLEAGPVRQLANKSNFAWKLSLAPAEGREPKDQEKGNIKIYEQNGRKLPLIELGERNPEAFITIPANTTYDMEFSHTKKAYFHAFTLQSLQSLQNNAPVNGGVSIYTRYTLSDAARSLIATVPEVELFVAKTDAKDELTGSKLRHYVSINSPNFGDITILGQERKPQDEIYKITNNTIYPWYLSSNQDSAAHQHGFIKAGLEPDTTDGVELDGKTRFVLPPESICNFWIIPGDDHSIQRELTIGSDVLGPKPYKFTIKSLPTPDHVFAGPTATCIEMGPTDKDGATWLPRDKVLWGSLLIQDPAVKTPIR